jgi:hypothetical protein
VLLLNVENFQKQQIKVNVCFEAGIRTRHQTAVFSRGFVQQCFSKPVDAELWELLAEEAGIKLTLPLCGFSFSITLRSIFTTNQWKSWACVPPLSPH